MNLSAYQLLLGALAALLVGFSKTGVPGLGILMVPLMALVFPAKESVGVLLPLLVTGDIFAVAFYRRHAQWNKLWNLFPSVAAGMAVAAWCLHRIDDQQMKPILGWLVLALIALDFVRRQAGWHDVPHHPAFVMTMGFLGGFGTTLGNVAGPIMTIYFLARGLERDAFIGTFSWFFLIVNVSKLPIYAHLDMLSRPGLTFDLWMVPLVTLGALAGKWILPRIPEKTFNGLVLVLAALTAVKLVWR